MRVVVVGAGPTGLFTAMALARRGHEVTVVDRDPGPQPDGSWSRRGVMQFHHPHAFRAQVVEALRAELPEVWSGLLTAGAQPIVVPNGSGGPEQVMGMAALLTGLLGNAKTRATLQKQFAPMNRARPCSRA